MDIRPAVTIKPAPAVPRRRLLLFAIDRTNAVLALGVDILTAWHVGLEVGVGTRDGVLLIGVRPHDHVGGGIVVDGHVVNYRTARSFVVVSLNLVRVVVVVPSVITV